jgi:hypothetical protein
MAWGNMIYFMYVHHLLHDQTTYVRLQAGFIEHTLTHVRNRPG